MSINVGIGNILVPFDTTLRKMDDRTTEAKDHFLVRHHPGEARAIWTLTLDPFFQPVY